MSLGGSTTAGTSVVGADSGPPPAPTSAAPQAVTSSMDVTALFASQSASPAAITLASSDSTDAALEEDEDWILHAVAS